MILVPFADLRVARVFKAQISYGMARLDRLLRAAQVAPNEDVELKHLRSPSAASPITPQWPSKQN